MIRRFCRQISTDLLQRPRFEPLNAPPIDNPKERFWRFVGGLVLQRIPVLSRDLEAWEQEWEDFEQERALRKYQHVPRGFGLDSEELLEWLPASRVTKADLSNNRRSLGRRLTENLYLIVKRDRKENPWTFPQGGRKDMEAMRVTAQREFQLQCGKEVQHHILGNHPFGYCKYKYPTDFNSLEHYKQYFQGTKLFLYESIYLGGPIVIDQKKIVDYAWVTKDELEDYLNPSLYSLCRTILLR